MSTIDQELRQLERSYEETKAHEDLILWVEALVRYGLAEERLKDVREKIRLASSMREVARTFKAWKLIGMKEVLDEAGDQLRGLWLVEGFLMQAIDAGRPQGASGPSAERR